MESAATARKIWIEKRLSLGEFIKPKQKSAKTECAVALFGLQRYHTRLPRVKPPAAFKA